MISIAAIATINPPDIRLTTRAACGRLVSSAREP